MASIVVVGAGMCGSLTAMLLAQDGHDVVVLDRDAGQPAGHPTDAWDGWERRSVRQFQMGHFFLPRFAYELQRELPAIIPALRDAGCLDINLLEVAGLPAQEGDERFNSITGRRPVVEAVVANALEASDATVHRGVVVKRLITKTEGDDGVHPPHVVGVESEDGQTFHADLIVDASGRNSSFPKMVTDAGGGEVLEVGDDSGYVYYGRTFASADGSTPAYLGGALQHYESVSALTLPADNGTWFTGIVAASHDKAVRKVLDPDVFEQVWRSYPIVAHWHDGTPIDGGPKLMAGIEDRIRHFNGADGPVATGVAAVGDSYACTNPSVGRGASIGLLHAIALRDQLREVPLSDPVAFADSWHERTEASVRPWYDDTLVSDHHRLAQIESEISGTTYETDDRVVAAFDGLQVAMATDPDLFRTYFDVVMLFRTKDEIFADGELMERALAAGPLPKVEGLGPGRAELLELLG